MPKIKDVQPHLLEILAEYMSSLLEHKQEKQRMQDKELTMNL